MELELEPLVKELERQKANSKDIIVDSRQLYAKAHRVVPNIDFDLVLDIPSDDDVVRSDIYPLTEHAHNQLADKTGIPLKYYNRMREAQRYDLVAENVNAWIHEKERRLIRILDNKVRAILSDRYRPMDNFDMVFCALEEFKRHDIELHRCDLTETYMYIKVFQPGEIRKIHSEHGEVSVIPGLMLSNSEVGAGSTKVEPALLNPRCKNVFIAGAQFRAVHLGSRRETGDIWADDTLKLKDEVLWREVRDTISAAFDTERFAETVDKLSKTAENEIESPTVAVDTVATRYHISEEKKKNLLDYFAKEPITQFGLSNAITRMAQDEDKAENQVELEHAGYDLAILKPGVFNKLTYRRHADIEEEGVEIPIED